MQITPERIREALAFIPAALPREDWARICMAVRSELPGDEGFALFDEWSATDAGSYDRAAVRATWRSVKALGGVGIGTLIHMAQERGYKVPVEARQALLPDPAKLAREKQEAEAARRKAQAERDEANEAAAEDCREIWHTASEGGADNHPYLQRKKVKAHGLRVSDAGQLLVPMRNADGELWSLQYIERNRPTGSNPEKRFHTGGRVRGLFHVVGSLTGADVILVAEGYATAASVHEATGRPVAVAFNAGNLKAVAKSLRKQCPTVRIVVAGDDDRRTEVRSGKNPGKEAANAAAALVHGLAVFPRFPHGAGDWTDFNDLHACSGLDAVRAQIEGALARADAAQPTAPVLHEDAAVAAPASDPNDPFVVTDSGVYYIPRDKEGRELAPMWLCSPLEVTARTRDADGLGWGFLLSFTDPAGRPREWAAPARLLAGDGGELRASLLNQGLQISTASAARNRFSQYLQSRAPDALATCTERCGWHPASDGGAVYVLPGDTIGESAERVVHQTDVPTERTFRQRGDVATWIDRIGRLCIGNSRLVFAVAAAFAGPLMRPAGVDSGGFHIRGQSSDGKTTVLRAAGSVNGGPGYMQRWRTTDNALELIAAAHCDATLILDELGQVDPKVAGEAAYLLANEQSKGRASRGAALRARLSWRLLFLSAGEVNLADHMMAADKRTRVGQEVRMIDIPADAGLGMGVFENLHDREGGAVLAHELGRAVTTTYGAPGRAWLRWLAPQWQGLGGRLRERMEALRYAWVPEGASGQVERVAQRFAVVAVAGELATEAGLTGWPAGEAERATRKLFETWLAQRGGIGNAEVRQMLKQVRQFLQVYGEGRFTWWHQSGNDRTPRTLQRAGVRRLLAPDGTPIRSNSQHLAELGDVIHPDDLDSTRTDFYIFSEVFQREVCQGFDHRAVAAVLHQHGCLESDAHGRYDCKPRVPGLGHVRCYHVTEALLELDL